jgi:hypothetical protein
VRNLLNAGNAAPPVLAAHPAIPSLDSLFAPPPAPPRVAPVVASAPPPAVTPAALFAEARPSEAIWPRAVADAFQQQSAPGAVLPVPGAPPSVRFGSPLAEMTKLKAEIAHLELLVKKLQTELQIERQYNQALELQVRALTHIE